MDKTSIRFSELSSPPTVELVADAFLPLSIGDFRIAGYRSLISPEEFIVLYKGQTNTQSPTLVRIHSQCLTGEVFGSMKCDCGGQLKLALERIEQEGRGVILYQMQEGRGIGIINKIKAYSLQDKGADTVEANENLHFKADLREYHQCAEILRNMGLRRIRLMTNNPLKLGAIEANGLEVVFREPIEVEFSEHARFYMHTKMKRLGHLFQTIK